MRKTRFVFWVLLAVAVLSLGWWMTIEGPRVARQIRRMEQIQRKSWVDVRSTTSPIRPLNWG